MPARAPNALDALGHHPGNLGTGFRRRQPRRHLVQQVGSLGETTGLRHVLDDDGRSTDLAARFDRRCSKGEPSVAVEGHVLLGHGAFVHCLEHQAQRRRSGGSCLCLGAQREIGALVRDDDPPRSVDCGDADRQLRDQRLEEPAAPNLALVHPIEADRCVGGTDDRHREEQAEGEERTFELLPVRGEQLVLTPLDDDEPVGGGDPREAGDRAVDVAELSIDLLADSTLHRAGDLEIGLLGARRSEHDAAVAVDGDERCVGAEDRLERGLARRIEQDRPTSAPFTLKSLPKVGTENTMGLSGEPATPSSASIAFSPSSALAVADSGA